MPSPKHPCAYPGCMAMVARKESKHCRKHAIKTPEHVAKVAAKNRGKKRTPEQIERLRAVKRGYRPSVVYGNRAAGLPVERQCAYCGKTFALQKPSDKQRFCSRACGYANRQGERAPNWNPDMPVKECFICGKQFRVLAKATADIRLTCSRRCKAIWQKKYHQPSKATDIERITEQALQQRGWLYRSQVPMCAVAIVDFYLPAIRTILFCDGDYWHSLPEHIERDKKQDEVLRSRGFTVIRLRGSAILKDIDACLSAIEYPSTSGI